jgi:hypothetical protein
MGWVAPLHKTIYFSPKIGWGHGPHWPGPASATDEHNDLDVDAFDGTSVIKTIKRNQEAEGVEFNVDDYIDA